MKIGRQWSDRLRIWAEEFPKHYYREIGSLPVCGFTTMEQLSFEQARQGSFAPAREGSRWGRKWEYGWFRTTLTVPEALAGQRLVFTLRMAEEMLVWVNGVEAGAIDKQHRFITLSRCAQPGTHYEIFAECYAGHGVRNEGAGPVAWGEESIPEPIEPQLTISPSGYGVWNEALFQTAMDYLTLYSLLQRLPEKSLRAMKVLEGLKQFTYLADFELPEPALTESVVEAGRCLKPLLECRNGSTAPEFTVFGQSHLDLAWLWPVEETIRKSARTYANQLALMEEYTDYRFLLCEPPILEWLAEFYPNVYQRVLEKTAEGAFYPEGGLWVESDTNIPSGESLIRQFVWGKRWFREKLGVEVSLAWMPDTFGFSGQLPQIMKRCRIPYFATQKLTRQDPEAEPFPYNLFWWEGIDGSRVLAHSYKKNNAVFHPGALVERWEDDRIQREGIDGMLFPYGYGDGGGGPTREMLEMVRRCADLEGAPRCRTENPVNFFRRQENVENVYCGELYLAWHRGTLTSQARTKRGIRKAEICLRQVEYAMSMLLLSGRPLQEQWKKRLASLWRLLLFNQFHDIAPGSSIARVYERAEKELEDVAQGGASLLRQMLGEPTQQAVAYNPLCFPRSERGVCIPAQGCAVLDTPPQETGATIRHTEDGRCYELKNARLCCRIDEDGCLCSVTIPGEKREFMAGKGNCFRMYKDVNVAYDAWEIGSMYEKLPVPLDTPVRLTPFSEPGGVGVRVERRLHGSLLTQRIFLGHQAQRLDFCTRIDWQERHKLLKVAFPVNVYATEAIQEIQFGYVRRPTHRSRQADRDRYEVCNHRYTALEDGGCGVAVLNDGKYGVSVQENEICLTLLKAPMMPDGHADQGTQEVTYSVYPFLGALSDSDILLEAAALNEPPILGAQLGLTGMPILLPRSRNIVVETIKPADSAPNALMARVYEAMGKATATAFRLSPRIQSVEQTDMLEENPKLLGGEGELALEFGPFEIKTLLLHLK